MAEEILWLYASQDQDFDDLSASANNGTAAGDMLVVATSVNGSSHSFQGDGNADRINLDSVISLPGDFTLSYHGRLTSTNVRYAMGAGSDDYFRHRIGNDEVTLRIGGTSLTWGSVGALQSSVYHYAVVRSGASINFYLDGVAHGTTRTNSNTLDLDAIFSGSSTGFGNEFNGRMEDIRIWDRALSSDQIASLGTPGAEISFGPRSVFSSPVFGQIVC